ncbi:MAG TPA: hypothetical protein VNL14_20555 [Candidatus Acidoferrales bacterium]|nr:hypothetical protein [Candidatus Acidoferrales bacterium]
MKNARLLVWLAGALVLVAGSWPLAVAGQASDSGQRREELRRPDADRSRGRSTAEAPARENEVIERLQRPTETERRQEGPLERQRRESYEAQKPTDSPASKKPPVLGRCAPGYVRREAYPGDPVCVTPETRAQVMRDNILAPSRRDPTGAKGLDTCIEGYVWREAYPGDRVCVTPETRAQTLRDNSEAVNRVAR